MKIDYQLISTSGNLTAVIYGLFPCGLKRKINKKIFKTNRLVEQIGYIYKQKNTYQFEMMGNEFSGNGCRAAGFSLLKFRTGKVKIKSSSVNKLLYISVGNSQVTTLLIPYSFTKKQILNNKFGFLTKMFGSFLLLIEKKGSMKLARKIITEDFKNTNAVGIIFIKQVAENKIKINPFFYVKETNTLINETACGSGSMAVAIYQTYKIKKSLNNLIVQQPSGEPIFVNTKYNDGKITQMRISGPTKYLGNYTINC